MLIHGMEEQMLDGNAVAERLHARRQGDLADAADRITKDDLAHAREDLIEKLFDGKRIGIPALGLDALLEAEYEKASASTIEELASFLRGSTVGGDYARMELCERMEAFATRLCEAHLDAHPDLIEERAQEIANDESDS